MLPEPCEIPQVYGTIIVSPDSKILLVKGRKSGKWSFPKGHPEKDETGYNCAWRETAEETGICLLPPSEKDEILNLSKGRYFVHRLPFKPSIHVHDLNEINAVQWYTIREMRGLVKNIDISCFIQNHSDILWAPVSQLRA
jgi:8-oxo-dGTP pyrophosphatase MutT (NUDIX family)